MHRKTPKTLLVNCRVTPPLIANLTRLTEVSGRSRSEVLRWLIQRATPADLPTSWVHVATEERNRLAEVER
jgi:hypothetical protein